MALTKSIAATTAVAEQPILKAAEQRIDIRDAIASADKPSKEQSLAESTALKDAAAEMETALASQDFKPVGSDFSRLDFSLLDSGKGADQDSSGDLFAISPEDIFSGSQGISFEELIANVDTEAEGENFSFFESSTKAERQDFLAAQLGLGELPPGIDVRTPEEIMADQAAAANQSPEDQAQELQRKKAEFAQFDNAKDQVAYDASDFGYSLLDAFTGPFSPFPGDVVEEGDDTFYEVEVPLLGVKVTLGKDEEEPVTTNGEETVGDGSEDSVECPPDDGERLTPEEKARLHETIGKELHVPRPGEAQADGDIDYGEDGAPIEVSGPGVDMEAVKDFLIGQPADPEFGGAGGDRTFIPDPDAGGEIDPTDDTVTNPHGPGPEDDPLDQGSDIKTSPPSPAESTSDDDGETGSIDPTGLDLRLADDPGAALKNEDFELQQSEPAVDIVPDFSLETLPLPGLDLGHVFGNDAFA